MTTIKSSKEVLDTYNTAYGRGIADKFLIETSGAIIATLSDGEEVLGMVEPEVLAAYASWKAFSDLKGADDAKIQAYVETLTSGYINAKHEQHCINNSAVTSPTAKPGKILSAADYKLNCIKAGLVRDNADLALSLVDLALSGATKDKLIAGILELFFNSDQQEHHNNIVAEEEKSKHLLAKLQELGCINITRVGDDGITALVPETQFPIFRQYCNSNGSYFKLISAVQDITTGDSSVALRIVEQN